MKKPGDIDGQVFDIADCDSCTLVVPDKCEQVQIDQVHNSKIFIGACASSIFVRNCSNCIFYLSCRQLRLREVTQSTFYVYSMAEVHIEYSNTLKFAPFNGGYPEQEKHMKDLKLDLNHNLWYDIFDHNDQTKSRCNWSLLPKSEYGQPWFPLGISCEPAVKLTEPGTVVREDGQVGQAFGVDQMIADSLKTKPPSPQKQAANPVPPTPPSPEKTTAVTTNATMSYFGNVPLEPPNSILGVALECKKDTFPQKVDLTIGAYRNEQGLPEVLPCVREAEALLHEQRVDHEYLSQDGLPQFVSVSQALLFGEGARVLSEGRVYSIQGLSGTGSLKLATDFIAMHMPGAMCMIPSVTWQNHVSILQSSRVPQSTYRYLDHTGCALDFEGMLADIKSAPEGSVILLHNCAHNPTGVDPTEDQWKEILQACQKNKLLPFFDNAYQGFVTGSPAVDAFAVRLFADAGMEMFVACSFAKNFGLYGERVGCLHVVTSRPELVTNVGSQLRALARSLYSTCPSYGARLVAIILSTPSLKDAWEAQCRAMAERLSGVRSDLYDELMRCDVRGTWDHLKAQRGMFSYSGISAPVVARLKADYHIYMLSNGRISLAGLNKSNISYFVKALTDILGTN